MDVAGVLLVTEHEEQRNAEPERICSPMGPSPTSYSIRPSPTTISLYMLMYDCSQRHYFHHCTPQKEVLKPATLPAPSPALPLRTSSTRHGRTQRHAALRDLRRHGGRLGLRSARGCAGAVAHGEEVEANDGDGWRISSVQTKAGILGGSGFEEL